MFRHRLVEKHPSSLKIRTQNKSLPDYSGQDLERKRIARELHDSIGSLLSTTILLFDTVKPVNEDRYKEVRELLSETQIELRRIVYNLMPATLEKLGLIPAIQQLCDYLNKSKQFEIQLKYKNWEHDSSIQYLDTNIYRIVQELLQNAVKHSKASILILKLRQTKNKIRLSLRDDGIGFANNKKKNMTLVSRVEHLNGDIKIIQLEKGAEVRIIIPK